MTKQTKITIVGAGLTGSLLSVLLGRRGYGVTLLERRADLRKDDVDSGRSINLALSSRGIHALKSAELMDDVRQLMIPMRGRMLHLGNGDTTFSPYGQRPDEVIYSISRRDLNHLLVTAAERAATVNIFFNQTLTNVDFANQQIFITNETTGQIRSEKYELLIGADGAGSRVRRAMMPAAGSNSVSQLLDHDYKELEIPAGRGGSYKIEKEALHIWPRGSYMLIALPNQGGSFTVTLFLPRIGEPSFESLVDPQTLYLFFAKHFPDALRLIPNLAQDFFQHPQGILGTVRCDRWYFEDNALIIGDAAHAIVPFHGQGMNAGFEDCSELMRLLDIHAGGWSAVLPEFDSMRRPDTNAIADMALENYITMRESVADPLFQLKKEIGFELEQRFPDRFIPRYSMVMFHRIPYAQAFARGEIQKAILAELAAAGQTINDIDFRLAEQLVNEKLPNMPG